MEQDLGMTVAVLARTPAALDALLRGSPAAWTRAHEGAGSWCPLEVVSHLIHADRLNWLPRIRHVLRYGESQPLLAFDQFGFGEAAAGRSPEQQLDEFASVRAQSLAELARRGGHPVLGCVTVAELLATWAVHDLTHLRQVSRTMAHQYREAVGPFSQFLGVLACNGHGAA
jgi:hypothetical protein